MNDKHNLNWLAKRVKALHSFKGSLLRYVNPPDAGRGDALRLDRNENFFVDVNFLKSIFLEVLGDVDLRLYDPDAIIDLKKTLGEYVGVPYGCVGVGSGSEHLIDFIIKSFLGKGEEAVCLMPSFFMYDKRILLSGGRIITVPLRNDLSLDVDKVLANCSDKTRLIFVCSPNNPAGNQFDWSEIEALVEGCSAVVIVDEAYAEFGDGSVCSKAVEKENLIVIRTFSKAFGLAGLRFGFFVACENLASALFEIIPYTVSTVVARFVVKLLDNSKVVQNWIEKVKKEREKLIRKLHSVDGLEVFDSKANFVTFKPKMDADRVYKGLLNKGIAVKNLGTLPVIGHCLRVTVGLPSMNVRFLNALRQVLEENKGASQRGR